MTNYRRRKAKPKEVVKKYTTNERISAIEVRVINEDGEMVGVMTREEALQLADDEEKDLIEINPKAVPPVVKLIEYSKFKYQMDKAEKNKAKSSDDTKTLRVSVRISVHDLLVQAKKADEFLKKNLKVKLQVQMRGREKSHPELAKETMDKFLELITGEYTLENEPKLISDSCFAQLKPNKS
jgi:translation initiation factor IF-3